jgi:hypothetical protein
VQQQQQQKQREFVHEKFLAERKKPISSGRPSKSKRERITYQFDDENSE